MPKNQQLLTSTNQKLHYKMYKKGRFWLFAGIVVMGIAGQGQTANAQTATTDSTTDDNQVTANQTTTVGQTATISQTTSRSASLTTNTSAGASTSTTSESTATTSEQTAQTATSATSSTTTSQASQQTTSAVTSQSTAQSAANSSESANSATNQTNTSATDSSATSAATTNQASSAASADIETVSQVQAPTSEAVSTISTASDVAMATQDVALAATTQDQQVTNQRAALLRAATVASDIASGTSGTAAWRIDSTDTLYIGTGTLAVGSWDSYADRIKTITFEGTVTAPVIADSLFSNLKNLITITNPEQLDISQTTSLALMFLNDTSLTSLDLSSWDVSKVTSINAMFSGDSSLSELNVAQWHTEQVKDMTEAFYGCSSLTQLDISQWNTSQLTDVDRMFMYCSSLESLDLTNWQTGSVDSFVSMFYGDSSLTSLKLANWNTSKVTRMQGMFTNVSSLKTLDLSGWDMSNVFDVNGMFSGDTSLVTLTTGNWQLTNMEFTYNMFYNCESLVTVGNTTNWNLGQVTLAFQMFYNCRSLTTLDVSKWQTGNITTMQNMFLYDMQLTNLDVSSWDTHSLQNAAYLFGWNYNLETIDISNWDTSQLTNFKSIFIGDTALKKITLGRNSVLQDDTTSVGLQAVPNNAAYTGYWLNTAGQKFTSAELMALYQTGSTTAVADTYTWQENKSSIKVQDTTVTQTPTNTWKVKDNFVSATDSDGQELGVADITTDGTVDTSKAGTYYVTYINGAFFTAVAKITVLETQATLNVESSTVIKGQTWTAEDNFKGATDANGQPLDFSQLTVTGNNLVDTSKVGSTYAVTYSFKDSAGNAFSQTVTVTVVNSQVAVDAKDSTIIQGQTWKPSDNLISVTAADGTTGDSSKVTILNADQIDTKKPGQYQVIYQYTDAYNNVATKTITLTVVATQASIDAHDTTIMQGQAWQASDSLDSVTTAAGTTGDLTAVTVSDSSSVNVKKPGQYQVTYQYVDAYQNLVTKTITVTVVATKVSIDAKDKTVDQDSSWTAADSFISATDATGKAVALSQVTVIGADKVDLSKAGQYQVTYQYTDLYGNQASQTITVTVKADSTGTPDPIVPDPDPSTPSDPGKGDSSDPVDATNQSETTPSNGSQAAVLKTTVKQPQQKVTTVTTPAGATIATNQQTLTMMPPQAATIELTNTSTVKHSKTKPTPVKTSQQLPQTDETTPTKWVGLLGLWLGLGTFGIAADRKRRQR
ncbi:BspA family leucine-rich repeat surface protein [Lactiplantibacillus mudanjiangensis]|uniref:Ig-like domain-containing protein n=1 Tax=Lactiplantibacillus mudanjiangensis TaxID=1296538 RepID=A0A660DXX8_9LACO|nr:BspA family leucine-rich repeat surface protein [Lactiplantibacillus mudanjiangensis]VDG25170.1 hypothetical protein [Lactobacillus sp. CBA3606] [Lactiplantibacillus mudanjiangensis]VDG28123.1 hypothetical protein [Lactobacillus sp. CBA3606] [Lactiplantibacillus mudanjiangensis]